MSRHSFEIRMSTYEHINYDKSSDHFGSFDKISIINALVAQNNI